MPVIESTKKKITIVIGNISRENIIFLCSPSRSSCRGRKWIDKYKPALTRRVVCSRCYSW